MLKMHASALSPWCDAFDWLWYCFRWVFVTLCQKNNIGILYPFWTIITCFRIVNDDDDDCCVTSSLLQIAAVFPGVAGILWFVFWWIFSAESPAKHPTITRDECLFIERSMGEITNIPNKVSHSTGSSCAPAYTHAGETGSTLDSIVNIFFTATGSRCMKFCTPLQYYFPNAAIWVLLLNS